MSMMLYLVHHAEAVGPEVDPVRPLSKRGRGEAELIAERAAARGARPAAIWHSGKVRARQTAEIFWKRCNPLATLTAVRGLQPDDPPSWIVDLVSAERSDVMIVGHFPQLPRLLGALELGQTDPLRAFPPHGLIALSRDEPDRWSEQWRLERPPGRV
jgi:phosphohistidine phosphatase